MRRAILCLLACSFALSAVAKDDYPLRVRIVQRGGIVHTHNGVPDQYRGHGVADVFENGEPRGFEFTYECSDQLLASSGWETFYARWKKKDQEIVVATPQFGKPGKYNTCNLKVIMKDDTVYGRRNGNIVIQTTAKMKEWMQKHDYDPEHNKNVPTGLDNTPADKPAPDDPKQ